jgi:glycosyltransferase involved in cell wall biosynthesis
VIARRLTHVIDGLEVGGAERMLATLLSGLDPRCFRSEVISLTDIGPVGAEIERMGIAVRALHLRPQVTEVAAAARLLPMLRRSRPDLVQTWLYEADLLGGIVARITRPSAPLIWNVQQGDLDPSRCKRRRIWAAKACGLLSGVLPTRIICCSEVAARVHVNRLGYAPGKIEVIPNAVDVESFAPDHASRTSVRRELGVPDDSLLVGLAARKDPQKDHRGFLRAAAVIGRELPSTHFVLCGKGVTSEDADIAAWVADEGLVSRCHLLGLRHDMSRIHASLDVAVSSSAYGEGLPVALLEAMACGIPCATTDVGDSGLLVGGTGVVVPPDDSGALAEAVIQLLTQDQTSRSALGRAACERVRELYSRPVMAERYQRLYDDVLVNRSRPR